MLNQPDTRFDRRGFLKKSSLATLTALLGADIVFADKLPENYLPFVFDVDYQLMLECAGNGRAGYFPKTSGNQWTDGGVGCAEWTGVRLKDILADVGLTEVWARATDDAGVSQPMVMPQWNPEGYCNNACHRIAVKVG